MAGEWTIFRLGDVCSKIGSGATPRGGSSVYLDNGTIALIRSQNIYNDGFSDKGLVYLSDKHAAQLNNVEVVEDDILLNITGDSVARACQVDVKKLPARVNQHVSIIRTDRSKLWPRYLRFFLVSPQMQENMLQLAGAGATRNALTKGMIESFEIRGPVDVNEQRAIAQILGALDDKIELNRRMNKTLEEMARAIFKSWFVDFDPVRAKAAGQTPPGLTPEITALFPDSFQDSELGQIPKGWKVGSILKQARLLSGGTPKTAQPEYWNGGIQWASAKDISQCDQCFLIATERTVSKLGLEKSSTQIIPAFSTAIVARGATTGRMVMFGSDIAMNQTCYALCSSLKCSFALYCQTRHIMNDLVQTAHGSVFDTITTNTFQNSQVVLPSPKLLEQFESIAAPLFEGILSKEKQSLSLVSLRDTLLPKLISGELRIKNAEKIIGRDL